MEDFGILVNIDDLRNIIMEKTKPFYLIKEGQRFRLSMDIALSHLCTYTKDTEESMSCVHGTSRFPQNILVYHYENK